MDDREMLTEKAEALEDFAREVRGLVTNPPENSRELVELAERFDEIQNKIVKGSEVLARVISRLQKLYH